MNYRAVLKFIAVHQPHMPELYRISILQRVFYICNYLLGSAIGIIPFQIDSVSLFGIVLNICKGVQAIVIIRAAIMYCAIINMYIQWVIL